ncbi:MAG: HEAT repeat domain-containing protein [Myxococcales bacterium]|nr:HEAT repeat domain-containing protein [Myxococcales bacterium]MCB9708654.1 HEAT repeat domain-containing protein [Myxococcales bacterium]
MTDLEALKAAFRQGVGAGSPAEAKTLLGLPLDAGDHDLAQALVRRVALSEIDGIDLAANRRCDPRPQERPKRLLATSDDRSFLGRLDVSPGKDRINIFKLDDMRALTAVLRAGHFRLRRAAARRIGTLLKDGSSETIRAASGVLGANRDVEIAYEVGALQRQLPGAVGRKARADSSLWRRLAEEFEGNIAHFWEGTLMVEPLTLMPAEKRAQLLLRTRDLHDESVVYLAAILECSDGMSSAEPRTALLQSLQYAADPRLVPSLRAVLENGTAAVAMEAARALGRTEDPRVHPALAGAYDRSLIEKEKIVFAGALGHVGDARGVDYVRSFLGSQESELVQLALESLESLGNALDSEAIALLLDHKDPEVIVRAIRALGRIGDVRALIPLRGIVQHTPISALRAEAEDALDAVRARMELRGEDVPEHVTAVHAMEVVSRAQLSAKRDPASVRFRSHWDWWVGLFWMLLGFSRRAVARFESAAARRPGWVNPLLSLGMIHARRDRTAQALTAFRRAIDADRAHVEHNPLVTRTLALCFLRRSEQVEQDGRPDVARTLLEEVLSLDLRYVPASVLFELRRRREAFRLRANR